jgi:uncharacterized protein (TIGR00730 family)
MKISVFGGSQPKPGSCAYNEARQLGELLAKRGHTVMTGGYIGTMEAASRGAIEAGGHVIGVTCDEIERWRPVQPNQWVVEEVRRETLIERMQVLIGDCDAAIALPGGVGTLTEIALMLNLMVVESMHRRPLVLVGSGWQSVFDQFSTQFDVYISAKLSELIQYAEDVETAVKIINDNL